MDNSGSLIYWGGFWLVWIVVFLGAWGYCAITYGFLLGFGLGWLPASILASILAFVWPLIAAAAVALWLYLSKAG